MHRNVFLALALFLGVALGLYFSTGEEGAREALNPSTGEIGIEAAPGASESDPGLHKLPRASSTVAEPVSPSFRAEELRGTCIDHHDLEGVPDVGLTLLLNGSVAGRAVSDEQGEFGVALSTGAYDEVRIDPPAGWWCVKHGLKAGAYQVRLAKDDLAPLRAKLVDRLQGKALPEFTVEIEGPGGWGEVLTSDADGVIESGTLFEAGTISLLSTEEEFGDAFTPIVLASHSHVPSGPDSAPVSIPLNGGLTYKIDLDNPGDVALRLLRVSLAGPNWNSGANGPSGQVWGVSVHSGSYPWVRIHWSVPNQHGPHLVIQDLAGRWRGAAPVDTRPGEQGAPVSIRLEAHVRLSGRVLDGKGEPVQGARVEAQLAGSREGTWPFMTMTSVTGLYIFERIPTGSYVVSAQEARSGRCQMELQIHAEDITEQDLHLEPYDVGGDVAGHVRSLSGTYRGGGLVTIYPLDTASDLLPRSAPIVWTKVGAAVEGHYKFADVAAGSYRVLLSRFGDFDFEPRRATIRAGEGGVDYLVRDDKRRLRAFIFAFDAETGERIPDEQAELSLLPANGAEGFEGAISDYRPARIFAAGDDFTWEVRAPGYSPRAGDRAAYEALPNGRYFMGRVHLDRLP